MSKSIDLNPTNCNVSECQARCCYNVAVPGKYYEMYQDKIVRMPIAVQQSYGDCVQPVQHEKDMANGMHACPWLTYDNRCNIYDHRPNICRLWGHSELTPLLGCENLGCKEHKSFEETPVYMLLDAPDIVYEAITGEGKPDVDRNIVRYFRQNKEITMADFCGRR